MQKSPPNHHIPSSLKLSDELLTEAADRFGTPLYVYDKGTLELCWRSLKDALPENVVIHYSVKANPNLAIIAAFHKLGTRFEVASLGELQAVRRVGIQASDIIFVGPGKSRAELQAAVEEPLQAVVVESVRELNELQALSSAKCKHVRVALRVNPGRGKGMLAMGGVTQFGMEPSIALSVLQNASVYSNLDIIGLHGYLGTRVLDWKTIHEHTEIILETANTLQEASGCEFTFIDIGGGFGIPLFEAESMLDLVALRSALCTSVSNYHKLHPKIQDVAVESGRFLIGPAGVFVARVLDVKQFQEQCFVILDGGINVFSSSSYVRSRLTPMRILNSREGCESLTICGPLCTPMDRLAASVMLPRPQPGDLIAFYQAGAYGLTASPGLFLSHGYPVEVMAFDQNLSLIRESLPVERLFDTQHQLPLRPTD